MSSKAYTEEAAKRLRQARKARGLSQDGLALKCGIALCQVQTYERCGHAPLFGTAKRLCEGLDISMDWLIGTGRTTEQIWEDGETLAEIVYYARHKKGMSREKMAEAAGISEATVENIEGYSNATMDTVLAISECLDLPLDYISGLGKRDGIE